MSSYVIGTDVEERLRKAARQAALAMSSYVIGIDVGTGSARAGLFDTAGTLLASAVEPIQIWKPKPDFVEQSSEDIWRAIGKTIRTALASAGVASEQVIGISYDST